MATIYCFSGTGNSLYAAKKIAANINAQVKPVTNIPAICSDDVVGLVFPVYFWGLPRMVERFASQLKLQNKNAYVFTVITGGAIILNLAGVLQKLLNANGIILSYSAKLLTTDNYIPKLKIRDSEKMRQKTDNKLAEIIADIKNRKTKRISMFTALNTFGFKFMPNANSDEHFTVATQCTGCGTCQKVCPAKNITLENSKPVFAHNCEHCLACIHTCPAKAIDWKEGTKGKQRYINHGVKLHELVEFYEK